MRSTAECAEDQPGDVDRERPEGKWSRPVSLAQRMRSSGARGGCRPALEDDLYLLRAADVDVVGAQRIAEPADVPRSSEAKPYWCSVPSKLTEHLAFGDMVESSAYVGDRVRGKPMTITPHQLIAFVRLCILYLT